MSILLSSALCFALTVAHHEEGIHVTKGAKANAGMTHNQSGQFVMLMPTTVLGTGGDACGHVSM